MEKIKTPTLFLLGGKDTMVSNETTKTAFANIKTENKEMVVFPEMDHFQMAFDIDY